MSKTKIDIFSGFLGAGKTTLIKKLIAEAYKGEKLVLIENEFGEIGIDGGFMQDAGIEVTEMNSGCICCSLVGDFGEALKKVIDEYHPERILIEPSGVGKLSDVIRAVQGIDSDETELNSYTAVCDAGKVKMYMRNFGEFYNNQIEHAAAVVMSHTDKVSDEKIAAAVEMIREHNPTCAIVTTPWSELTGEQILAAIEQRDTLADELKALEKEETCPVCGHHHHDHDHEHEHHHHDHDEHCDCHEHEHHHEHHHHHDEECHCHDHEHHHDHDENDHGHHHHHADDVFNSWGKETSAKFSAEELREKLMSLTDEEIYGAVLRAKGIVADVNGGWLHFDYVPGEADVRSGSASTIGRICVIGAGLKEDAVEKLF